MYSFYTVNNVLHGKCVFVFYLRIKRESIPVIFLLFHIFDMEN